VALTSAEVSRLAALARIDLSEEEAATIAPQLDVILDAVASVADVARADIAPTSHAIPLTNVFRADELKPSWPAAAMLAAAPVAQDQRFRVPRILEEEQ